MNPVSRGTPAGEAYLDLKSQARQTRQTTQELLQLYVLEGFLARLTISEHKERFVLKGGVLLAAFNSRRPTKDIDLAGIAISNDTATIVELIRKILKITPATADGIEFATDTLTVETIREEDHYSGVRVHVKAHLASAELPFHIDVNVGDPIWPEPITITMPRLRGGPPIKLSGYPMHMVYAEKIVTAMQRGTANTRWRDFGDIWSLAQRHHLGALDLRQAINAVARHRNVSLHPLTETLDGFASIAQDQWSRWRQRSNSDHLPENFKTVLSLVTTVADITFAESIDDLSWDPHRGIWLSTN